MCIQSVFQRKFSNSLNYNSTFDTVKQITLCDILSSEMTLFAARVILAFRSLAIYPIDLLEIEMMVKESKGKICKEGTNNEQNAHVEASHFYVSHLLKILYKIFLRVLTDSNASQNGSEHKDTK